MRRGFAAALWQQQRHTTTTTMNVERPLNFGIARDQLQTALSIDQMKVSSVSLFSIVGLQAVPRCPSRAWENRMEQAARQ